MQLEVAANEVKSDSLDMSFKVSQKLMFGKEFCPFLIDYSL